MRHLRSLLHERRGEQPGAPWSTAAYVTDFPEKTTPDDYRGGRPEHDNVTIDASDRALVDLWDAAIKHELPLNGYGKYAERVPGAGNDTGPQRVHSLITSLAPYTNPAYPELTGGRHKA
ncbi:MAG: hypothetical protein M3Y05_17590 [Gemmatimonadota bacterium]|nr:hypothetical protein [Gemmatimonadota bacterium]